LLPITAFLVSQKIVPKNGCHNITTPVQRRLALMFFVLVACHIAKGGLLNVIGKEINSLSITELKASISDDNNMLKGHVVYIDHFGNVVTNISKRQFIEFAKGRPYEIIMKTKNIKTILPITPQLPAQINIRLKIMKEKNWLFLMKLVSKLPFSEVTLLKWVQQIVY
jgi:hypothetical protein